MSISALAYTDQLDAWTANNIVSSGTEGDYDLHTFHELELSYPGHFGKGFWIVTGESRITDTTDLEYASIHLFNETTALTYGACGGYVYDTEWHSFSIIAGWSTDLPSTMQLMVALGTHGATDIVQLRNVRLAFVQIADVNGLKVTGRDANTAGYHQLKTVWDYSPFTELVLAPDTSNTILSMTVTGLNGSSVYEGFVHLNGLDHYGPGSANTQSIDLGFPERDYSSGVGLSSRTIHSRMEPGHYLSYGNVFDFTTAPSETSVVVFVDAYNSGVANTHLDLYGGYFAMIAVKPPEDVRVTQGNPFGDITVGPGTLSVNTSINSNTAAPITRYLVFATGGGDSNAAYRDTSVSFGGETIFSANNTFKGGTLYNNPQNYVAFGNITSEVNDIWNTTRIRGGAGGSWTDNFHSILAIPLDRDYVNSCTALPAQANNHGSGSQKWGTLTNLYSANVTHYAAMANVSTTAANNAYLKVTNFGFDEFIPEGSEIGYIWMMPVYRKSGTGALVWDNVRMVADGSVVGSSCAWSTPWDTSWTYVGPDINYGVTTYWDLDFNPAAGGTATRDGIWGYRPTAAQVRASNFGFQMRCKSTSGTPTAQVAYVFAVVYYRAPGETFMRSVTCTANSIAVASMGAKDVSKDTSTTAAQTATAVKATVPVVKTDDFTATVTAITKAASKPFSGVVGNVVSIGRTFTKGMSVAANNVATNIKAITRTTIGDSANTTSTIGRAITKPNSFTMQQFWVGHKDTVKATLTASANSTATASKNTTKPSSLSQGKTVSLLKAITKPRAIVAASAKTLRKNVVKPVANTFSSTVALFDAHKLYHYILDLGTTVVATATVQKAIAATRSTTQATAGSLAVNWNYTLNLAAATFSATASIVKTPIKNAAITVPSVKTIRKAATHALATTVGASATIVKRPLKAVATTVGTTVSRVRSIAKGFTKTAPSTKTFRKNAGKPVASSFTASVSSIRKAATRRLAITQGTTRTVLKAITRPYSKVAASTKTFRKNVGKPVAATAGATASILKNTARRLTTTAASVVEIQKGIVRRVAGALGVLVKSFSAEKQSRTKYLRWVSTAFEGFRETANSVLRLGMSEGAGSYEYITYTTHAVAAPDETTWRAPAVEADELKPSHTDTTELKI